MPITADQVKQLREMTGAGMMECKKALADTGGDLEKAVDALRKSGAAKAEKRSGRSATEGRVESYIHPGSRVGVLVEVNCETDFVARTDDFGALSRDLAMQVAAAGAEFVRREEVPADRVAKEREIFAAQLANEGKPASMIDKIVDGKLESYYAQACLLDQPSVRDPAVSIRQMIAAATAKTGENVTITRFTRFKLGETA